MNKLMTLLRMVVVLSLVWLPSRYVLAASIHSPCTPVALADSDEGDKDNKDDGDKNEKDDKDN